MKGKRYNTEDKVRILREVDGGKSIVEVYRNQYNHQRPHSNLGYQSPAHYAASLTPSLAPVRPAKPGLPSARDGQPASAVSTSTNRPDRL